MVQCWSKTRRAGVAFAASMLAVLAAGCDQSSQSQAKGAQTDPAPPQVTVSKPITREIVEWDEYTGRFDSVQTVEIRARVSGYLDEVHFTDGQNVKKGDLLFVIDPRPFERTLEQAQAELLLAKTKVQNLNLDVVRGRPLVERRIISEKTFDDRENLVREAQASEKVAEAKVRSAELDLSFARITSPIAGRISRNMVSVGNWVSAGGIANAALLTTIVSQDPIYIYFDVSERNYLKYRRQSEKGDDTGTANLGAVVEVELQGEQGYPHKGKLDFLDNRLDQGTGTLRARAVLSNKSGLFSPGMFARVRVTGSERYVAVLLPDEAIGTDHTNKYVYAVGDDGTVVRRNVTLGPIADGLRVVRDGLGREEWVVTKGTQRARPGERVTANRVAIADAPPARGDPSKAQE
jgi:multidrug efflux system membrane fusion protein